MKNTIVVCVRNGEVTAVHGLSPKDYQVVVVEHCEDEDTDEYDFMIEEDPAMLTIVEPTINEQVMNEVNEYVEILNGSEGSHHE